MLKGKKIIIGITGSIAAYKIPILIRLLLKEGAIVQIIMTPAAKDFVTPLTLSTLSGKPALCEGFNKTDGSWNSHIELGNWADIFLIAPVTANTLAKMVSGLADNLLVATYLAAKCPVFFAPAMDTDMYKHPSTQKNVKTLCSYGNYLIKPQEGELASGLCGAGRMEEPEKIIKIIAGYQKKKEDFKNKKILITAGPTCENIDPVRFISNHSSGLMGFELARECAERGAKVSLITGPVHISISHPNIHLTEVTSAAEMHKTCLEKFQHADITIMAAAVADYTPKMQAKHKIKKASSHLSLELERTSDILAEMGKRKKNNQFLVGFALETENETENAIKKLKNKNLDIIVINSLKDKGAGFGHLTNKVSIMDKALKKKNFALKSKREVAIDIANEIKLLYK